MFYSTEDAIAQGMTATVFDRVRWGELRQIYLFEGALALKRCKLNLAAALITQGQFCREAIEAYHVFNRGGVGMDDAKVKLYRKTALPTTDGSPTGKKCDIYTTEGDFWPWVDN